MPYAPGVQDISGQIRAQYMMQGRGALGQGIASMAEGFAKQKEEMQALQSKIKGFEAVIKNDPESFGLDEEKVDALLTGNPNETTRQKAQRIQSFVEATMTQKTLKQAEMARVAQEKENQLRQAQIEQIQATAAQRKNDADILNKVFGSMGPRTTSEAGEVVSANVPLFSKANSMAPTVSATGEIAPATTPALQSSVADISQFSTKPVSVQGKFDERDILPLLGGLSTEGFQKIAPFLKTLNPSSRKPDLELQRVGAEEFAFSPGSGAAIPLPKTPERLAKEKEAEESAKLSAKSADDLLNDVSSSAETGRQTSSDVNRVIELYGAGAKSGFAQPVFTGVRSALARITGEDSEIRNQQELEQKINNIVLQKRRELMKGTGAVSDYETKSVEKAMANMGNTPGANIRILKVLQNAADRAVKLDELRLRYEEEGLTKVQIAKKLRADRAKMPIGVESLTMSGSAGNEMSIEDIKRKVGIKF